MLSSKRLRVVPNIVSRIHRVLPGKGRLNVVPGAEVKPSDIIGVSEISSGFRILNLASLLSVPANEGVKYLKKDIGARIYKGELLAYKEGGIFGGKKIVTAPSDSTVDFVNPQTGEVRMSILPKKVELPSGVYGVVEAIDTARSRCLIKTLVSKVYGVVGTGRPRDGILHTLGKRDQLIVANMISPTMSDQIILGGSLIYKDAISASISSGVSGIITGGINAADYRAMAGGKITFPKRLETDVGISLIVTEGFGSISIGEDIYKTLSQYDGKFVTIDGNSQVLNLPSFESNSLVKIKSFALPPLNEEIAKVEGGIDLVELKVGMKVRVLGPSFAGEQGKIVAVDKSESLLPSQVRAVIVTLETKRRKIQIPSSNLEII